MAAEDKTEDEVETEIDDQEARATTDEESDAKVSFKIYWYNFLMIFVIYHPKLAYDYLPPLSH